jgi:hypothetical protein
MTAERRPTDPTEPEPPPIEPPPTSDPSAQAGGTGENPADTPMFEAAATDGPSFDAQAAAEAPAIEGQPLTAPPLEPAAGAPPVDDVAETPVAAAPAARSSRTGAVARGGLRFIQFAIGVGLFVVGVYLGTLAFQAAQRDPATAGAGAVADGVPTPPVVQEFASALGSGGADAVRSSVSPEVFALLASELKRWQFNAITKVEVLSTATDGPQTATGIVMTGPTSAGNTLSMNLIVQTEGGRITTLR